MKSLPLLARLYLIVTYSAGLVIFLSCLKEFQLKEPWLLVVLCILASVTLLLKVEGTAERSYYTLSFVVYGFTFAAFGASETMLVILVSHIVEWLWFKPPWFIQAFTVCAYFIAVEAAEIVYVWINGSGSFLYGRDTLALLFGIAVFCFMGHWMSGILIRLARKESIKKSGLFHPSSLLADISLLYFGASLSIVWKYNPFAILLFAIPAHFMYRALQVPALERKTLIDSKTGLFNHAYFKKQLEGELARSNRFDRPLSVIIADLDLLREINNTYGHLAGDEVLIGVSKAMKLAVREYDVVARFGGEEFAILLPETTLLQAYKRAEELRKIIEAMEFNVSTSMAPIRATMSFGVAQRENDGQAPNEIVHNADQALYNSKMSGRNKTYIHSSHPDLPLVS